MNAETVSTQDIKEKKDLQFIHGGKDLFDKLEQLIREAEKTIHLQTYIFVDDETGQRIANALIDAAQRGVQVWVVVDGYASQSLPKEFVARIREAGVWFRFFEPLFKSSQFYFGRRLHHKVFVADEKIALVCGANIANRYNDMPDEKAWLDAGVIVTGRSAKELAKVCDDLYHKRKKKSRNYRKQIPERSVQVLRNDWVMGRHDISLQYRRLFTEAKENILIFCSYFLPGHSLRRRLSHASKRGVKIKVVLTGESDVWIAKHAERYLYRWMLRHKIEVYEYQRSVLHAKLAIADDDLMTIGSYNVNDLSSLASVELNVAIRDKEFVQPIAEEFRELIKKDCCRIGEKSIRVFSFTNFLQFLCFYTLQIALKLSTFYFHKR